MKLFNKIGLVGLGLIGGSLGMAIKKNGLTDKVVGVSRKTKTIKKAKKIGAIDQGSLDFDILKGCDLIILCAPVKTIIRLFSHIKPYVNGAIVSDVGSTKLEIINAAKRYLPKNTDFIGAHPLAGSEKRGIASAEKGLFSGSLCLLTPIKTNKRANIRKLKLFWERLGAKVKVIAAEEHDKIISATSHLPHLTAFGLIAAIPESYFPYAASGLKDTTRIASSDPLLWTEIFLTNPKAVIKSIIALQKELAVFSGLIRKKDAKTLFDKIKRAKIKRDKLI